MRQEVNEALAFYRSIQLLKAGDSLSLILKNGKRVIVKVAKPAKLINPTK